LQQNLPKPDVLARLFLDRKWRAIFDSVCSGTLGWWTRVSDQ
jgi:hypothetical protein